MLIQAYSKQQVLVQAARHQVHPTLTSYMLLTIELLTNIDVSGLAGEQI